MLKKTPKTFNARFDKEVFWAIAELLGKNYGRDKTEVVSRAIMEAQERVGEALPRYVPSAPVMVQTPVVPEATTAAPFEALCRHCGVEFGAWNRKASVCPSCKKDGHGGEPRECEMCNAGGAL